MQFLLGDEVPLGYGLIRQILLAILLGALIAPAVHVVARREEIDPARVQEAIVELGIGRFVEENLSGFFPYFRISGGNAVAAMVLAVALAVASAAIPAIQASRLGVDSGWWRQSTPSQRSGSGLMPKTNCPSRYLATLATSPS